MNKEGFLAVENTLFTVTMLLYFASMVLFFIFIAVHHSEKDSRDEGKSGRIAWYVLFAGFVLHTAALILRGIGAGRLPMTKQ